MIELCEADPHNVEFFRRVSNKTKPIEIQYFGRYIVLYIIDIDIYMRAMDMMIVFKHLTPLVFSGQQRKLLAVRRTTRTETIALFLSDRFYNLNMYIH